MPQVRTPDSIRKPEIRTGGLTQTEMSVLHFSFETAK
jgi:hypothetical protein